MNHRRKIANIYSESLKNINGVRITIPSDNIYHSYYKYYFFIDPSKFKISRDNIIQEINKHEIPAFVGSCGEVYMEESMSKYRPDERLKNSIILFDTSIMLLCDPTISLEKAGIFIDIIVNILNQYN